MTTIHVVIAEKQYSSSKVLAAFDDAELAGKLKDTIEATEPRWTITVQPVELQMVSPQVIGTARISEPFKPASFVTTWNGQPEEVDAQGRSARIHGGPVKGAMAVGDDGPEVFIPSTSAAADKL